MKILLDECIPARIGRYLTVGGHELGTVQGIGMSGADDGSILTAADRLGYEILLTVDRGFLHQQNMKGRRVAVMILTGKSRHREHLMQALEDLLDIIERRDFLPGEVDLL